MMKQKAKSKKVCYIEGIIVLSEQSPGECSGERQREGWREIVRSLLDKSHLTTGSSLSLYSLSLSLAFRNSCSLSLSGIESIKREREGEGRKVLKEEGNK